MSINKVIIIGNLGRDPETRDTRSGTVVRLSVATAYRPRDGEEQTEWHRVTVFGKQAEACARYLSKGRQVYVEGRLHTSSYEKNGEKRYSTEIIAERVQFLGGKGERRGDGPAPYDGPTGGYDGGDDDDIPF